MKNILINSISFVIQKVRLCLIIGILSFVSACTSFDLEANQAKWDEALAVTEQETIVAVGKKPDYKEIKKIVTRYIKNSFKDPDSVKALTIYDASPVKYYNVDDAYIKATIKGILPEMHIAWIILF